MKEFFRTYYTPNNLSLVIAGDFDPAEAKRLVEKYFGPHPARPGARPPDPQRSPKLDGEKIVEVNDRVPQERVYIAWPTPPCFEPGDAELDLARSILTDGLSSRLNKTLVYDKQLASDVAPSSSRARSPATSSSSPRRGRARRSRRSSRSSPTRSRGWPRRARPPAELDRAKTKREFAVRHRAWSASAASAARPTCLNQLQHLPRRPRQVRRRRGALSRRHGRERARGGRHAGSTRATASSSASIPRPRGRLDRPTLDRSKQPALGADRPFRRPR